MVSQSTHTEPAGRPHTSDELMHPGSHHHASSSMTCPDPSAHKDNPKLQLQASSAALQASSTSTPASRSTAAGLPTSEILDKDNNLSSRSAALSLKHARAEDLPSYPVVGVNTDSSLSAASLANKSTKSFEHWKPDASASASKAAMLANSYKSPAVWRPEMSAAGLEAAILAHRDGGKVNLCAPSASADGNSAASQAMRNKGPSPQIDYGYTKDGRSKALVAATDAASKGRARSESTPVPAPARYPDAANSNKNALSAALHANRPSKKQSIPDNERLESEALEAARIRYIGDQVSREMWTEHPPVQLEVEEKNHNAALRASAVSMAKQLYETQQKVSAAHSAAQSAASASSRANQPATAAPDLRQQATQYLHLQEAAYKLAQERLAKMDPDGAARYREHYGYDAQPSRSRLSLLGRPRRPASEGNLAAVAAAGDDSDSSDYDTLTSRRIQNQMSQLNQKIQDTDSRKREKDRANVLAAAERKVHAQLQSMDERVFAQTGKVSPAMQEQWEAKARAKAKKDSDERIQHHGKTYIGNGRYLDSAEIEAIAAARLKPTLDEISETAARRRQYDEALKLEEEANKRKELRLKSNEQHDKIEVKRAKHESKMMAKQDKLHQKAVEKEEKLVAKQIKAQQKEAEKERKKAIKKDIYLEKRERSRSRSRKGNKIYGSDAANRSGTLGVGSSTNLNDARPSTDLESGSDVHSDIPPVPHLDREAAVADDGAGATQKAVEPITGFPIDLSKGKGQGGTDGQAQIQDFHSTHATASSSAAPLSDSSPPAPRSPVQQVTRLFHKLTARRSHATTAEDKDKLAEMTKSTEMPEPEVKADVATVPAVASVADVERPTELSGDESPSSFTRHETPLNPVHSSSSFSSSDSDAEDDEPRGRQGRRHKRNTTAPHEVEADTVGTESGLMPSTVALLTGVGEVSNKPHAAASASRPETGRTITSRTEDEEFEEAKDTFESAPDAADASSSTALEALPGQQKATSPARETKFIEEV